MTQNAPIAFFCFNRPDKTEEVLNALEKNELASETEIFIFCDGPRNIKDLDKIEKVHQIIEKQRGFKKINIFKKNLNVGIKNSIISGVNQVFEKFDKIIVVEDDILTSKGFLKFINQSLDFYENDQKVWCVTGFNYPHNLIKFPQNFQSDVFFIEGKNCAWGWGTWKDRWQKIDFEIQDFDKFSKNKKLVEDFNKSGSNMFEMLKNQNDGKIDAWDIQMSYSMFKEKAVTIHSSLPLVKNIGFDQSGTHTNSDLKITDFDFAQKDNFSLAALDKITDNKLASDSYISPFKKRSFLNRWINSKKRQRNLKWLAAGFALSELIRIIF